MKLWPRETLEICTRRSLAETIARLQAQVEPKRWFLGPWSRHKLFNGEVAEAGFRLQRVITYRNDFRPVILGSVRPDGRGCIVSVEMRLPYPVAAFLALWASVTTLFLILAPKAWQSGQQTLLAPMIPPATFLLACLIAAGAFWLEAVKTRRILRQLLADEDETPA